MNTKKDKPIELPQEWPGSLHYGIEEVKAVTRIVKAQSPFRFYGVNFQHEVEKLEEEFADYIGVKYCLGVSHGTAALQVAFAAMGVGPGDEVLMPGYFWVSTVGAVVRSGAIPVLVDVDRSFNMDPENLEKKITKRTKAAVMVPMGGVMGQVSKVAEVCKRNKIFLLEDCAQSSGASQFGKKAGSFGDIAIFSFQINKNITAGEGGAIVTNSEELYKKAFAIHDLGYIKDEEGNLDTGNEDYQFWGIGCRMNEVTAAIIRVQLKKIGLITSSMRNFKYELVDIISCYKGIGKRHIADPSGDSGGFLKMTFDNKETSIRFKEKLIENGIKVRQGGYYPVHMLDWGMHVYSNIPALVGKKSYCGHHSVWELKENDFAKDYKYEKGILPILDDFVERTVLFCIASKLNDEHKALIKKAFTETCNQLLEKY
ncbi:MAG: DegT/DnrJ/EryC1/StrS family aminotransferase [Mariniphaga sp.]|nr:DegT/DnrJ/EryC1/StrS family aminotransferase [Mariniphaga sp.]